MTHTMHSMNAVAPVSFADVLHHSRRTIVPDGRSTSTVWRVWLDEEAKADSPLTVILKQTRSAEIMPEVLFYQELGPQLVPLVPRVFAANYDAQARLSEVVLADLSMTHLFPHVGEMWNEAQIRQILSGYARLHAAASRLAPLPTWIPSEKKWRPSPAQAMSLFGELMGSPFARHNGRDVGTDLETALAALDTLPPLDALITEEPFTLLHGDCWIANIGLPRAAGDSATFIDWDLINYGPETLDIANLLLMQPDASLRARWPLWLDVYWRERERLEGRPFPSGWDPEIRQAVAVAGALPFIGHVHRNVLGPPTAYSGLPWWRELFTMLVYELPLWLDLHFWANRED